MPPSRELAGVVTQLAKLDAMPPARRFGAIATAMQDIKGQLSRAREDAVIAWVDELMTRKVRPLSRADAIKHIMVHAHLAKSSVANVLIKAERRYGRPKYAVGRPRNSSRNVLAEQVES